MDKLAFQVAHLLRDWVGLSLRGVKSRVPWESNLVGAHGDAPFLDSRFHGNDGGLLRSVRNDSLRPLATDVTCFSKRQFAG